MNHGDLRKAATSAMEPRWRSREASVSASASVSCGADPNIRKPRSETILIARRACLASSFLIAGARAVLETSRAPSDWKRTIGASEYMVTKWRSAMSSATRSPSSSPMLTITAGVTKTSAASTYEAVCSSVSSPPSTRKPTPRLPMNAPTSGRGTTLTMAWYMKRQRSIMRTTHGAAVVRALGETNLRCVTETESCKYDGVASKSAESRLPTPTAPSSAFRSSLPPPLGDFSAMASIEARSVTVASAWTKAQPSISGKTSGRRLKWTAERRKLPRMPKGDDEPSDCSNQ
mmetsp:Transcript_13497/g.31011  ORF Transcript_13497/g.31011 Transcript_13497/m.31011 type:complete len:289 (-) Transcript_13497:763-1629(-)